MADAFLPFVLASASPRRLALLRQLGVEPCAVMAAELDETPRRQEIPRLYARRLAEAKARAVAAERPSLPVLGADTVVALGRRILPKAEDDATVRRCLALLSGRRHHVWTTLALKLPGRDAVIIKESHSVVRFKRLEPQEAEEYVTAGDGIGKAGGYAIQGLAGGFVAFLSGSYSSVVGLPLFETRQLLRAHLRRSS